jgi:hypothetical protein
VTLRWTRQRKCQDKEKNWRQPREMLRKPYTKPFWGLKGNPFNVNPTVRLLFMTKDMEEALSGLMYGIQTRKGIITPTGEVETGKTTLINPAFSISCKALRTSCLRSLSVWPVRRLIHRLRRSLGAKEDFIKSGSRGFFDCLRFLL